MGFRDPKTPEQSQSWFYEHELLRLRASERAGFKVDKERLAIEAKLRELRP